jgi:hypothetical protein
MLTIRLAAIADTANVSREGKLNITGIFNNINAPKFPVKHPWMVLVFVIEGDRGDAGAEHKLKVDLIDEDGNHMIPTLEGTITFGPAGSGNPIHYPQIIQLANVEFKKPGRHEFKILLNGEVRSTVPINIALVEKQK